MSKRDRLLLLEDMLESSLKIKKYTHGIDHDSFMRDEKTIDAVIRNFEIIGEAANRINPDFRIKILRLNGKEYVDLETELFMTTLGLTMRSSGLS